MFLNSTFDNKEFWDNSYVRMGKVLNRDEVDIIISEINTNDEMQDLRKNKQGFIKKLRGPSVDELLFD